MRQFYQRAVTLARGQRATFDINGQRFAHYKICRKEASGELHDYLWLSRVPSNGSMVGENSWTLVDNLNGSTRARLQQAQEELRLRTALGLYGCRGKVELTVDLVLGNLREYQDQQMRSYVRRVLGLGGKFRTETVFVLSLCYWHVQPGDAKLWAEYRDFILDMRRHARRVVLVTCPLPPSMKPDALLTLANRNKDLAALVASDSQCVLRLLDAAVLVQNVPANATLSGGDPHYACTYHSSRTQLQSGPVSFIPPDGARPILYDTVFADRGGGCHDAVNFSLWQALLCLLDQERPSE